MRSFYCELKCRPPDDAYGGKLRTGEQEELIDVLILEVPKLKNSNIEKQWALAQPAVGIADIWNKLQEPEFTDKGINQVFIFTAKPGEPGEAVEPGELIIRLETNKFEDEPSRKLVAPEPTVFKSWQQQLDKQFVKIYGFTIKQWRENNSARELHG